MKPNAQQIKAIEQSSVGIFGTIYYPGDKELYELFTV